MAGTPRVHGRDHALAAEFLRRFRDQRRAGEGGGVDAAFVGTRQQQPPHVVRAAHPPAHGERQEDFCGCPADHVQDGIPLLVAGGDVEEGEFVRPGRVVDRRLFDRVAGIAQIDEVHAFDHAAVFHVQAGDDVEF